MFSHESCSSGVRSVKQTPCPTQDQHRTSRTLIPDLGLRLQLFPSHIIRNLVGFYCFGSPGVCAC
jgi:hypothetical protein